jgi:hypothetical protein
VDLETNVSPSGELGEKAKDGPARAFTARVTGV